jgi:hypothetical protein
MYIKTYNLIINVSDQGPCLHGGIDSELCHWCKVEKREYLLSVLHIHPVRGGATAFSPRSISACGFRMWLPDVPAFLRSTRCATALVTRSVSPERPDISHRMTVVPCDCLID